MFSLPDPLEICSQFLCSAETKQRAAAASGFEELVTGLHSENRSREAVEVLTRSMPPENSLDWAAESIKMAEPQVPFSEEELALVDEVKKINAALPQDDAVDLTALKSALRSVPSDSPAFFLGNGCIESQAGSFATSQHMASGTVLLSASAPEIEFTAPSLEALSVPKPDNLSMPVLEGASVPALEPQLPEEMVSPEELAGASLQLDPFLKKGLELAKTIPGWA